MLDGRAAEVPRWLRGREITLHEFRDEQRGASRIKTLCIPTLAIVILVRCRRSGAFSSTKWPANPLFRPRPWDLDARRAHGPDLAQHHGRPPPRRHHPGSTTHLGTAVDMRSPLGLPAPFTGMPSTASRPRSRWPRSKGLATAPAAGMQAAARAVRAEIEGATAEKFRDLLGFVERTDGEMLTRLSIGEDLAADGMLLISYFGFERYELDFGPAVGGRIEAFRLPSEGLGPGIPVVLPRLPDGSVEFAMCEREDVVGFLLEDEGFCRFAALGSDELRNR